MAKVNRPPPLLPRLDASSCDLCREAAAFIRALQTQHNADMRDAERDAQASATEARWQESQGDDYGSY